ncbi:MAG: SDR family NAD(P)-dependent oxidoreductase [Maritimibacter sp.]
MELSGKTVVVTGGGSGIGRALVAALLAQGARVAAVDLDEAGLEETKVQLGSGDRLTGFVANIADRARVMALPDEIETALGPVDILINNAGVIQPFADFNDLSFEVIDRMVTVNLVGPINMTKAFLPRLMARPEAHLVNVSSMGGFIPFPGQTLYSASKAAVKVMTEGIYAETLGSSVHVSVVLPGAVNTNIMKNSGVESAEDLSDAASAQALPADEAAKIILEGIEANKLHILVGKDSRLLFKLVRLMPARAIRIIQKQMKKMGR